MAIERKYNESGMRAHLKCSKCGKYLTMFDIGEICYGCKLRKKERTKALQARRVREKSTGLQGVLKRRMTSALARAKRMNTARSRRATFDVSNITMKYLLELYDKQKGLCALSGRKMSLGTARKNVYEPNVLSIDRIDSTKGYIEGNIQLVTYQVNVAKGRDSNDDLLSLCRDIIAENERKTMQLS